MRVYWFRSVANFGDALAPLLVEKFAGVPAVWAPPQRSDGVVIGSIAGRLPHRYYGVVVGIGKFSADLPVDLRWARVLGLRGLLTLKDAKLNGDPVLGDPGLLVADLLGTRPDVIHPLGIVPHFTDTGLRSRYPDAHYIDVSQDPITISREIASCERIISSSMHGLIAADSFGIPRRWEIAPAQRGHDFKFRDYGTALGIDVEPDRWDTAPHAAVASVVAALLDVFREIPCAAADEKQKTLHRTVQIAEGIPSWLERRTRRLLGRRSPRRAH